MKISIRFKLIILLTIFSATLFADENYLNIDAKHFESDEKKQVLIFKDAVKMTKNKDILLCDHLLIKTQSLKENPKKQLPKSYKATGNVSFTIYTVDNIMSGKGDTLYYYPNEQKYMIVGNGYLEDKKEGKKIVADTIYIDEKTGKTRIEGGDKPAKFRLKLNEGKNQ